MKILVLTDSLSLPRRNEKTVVSYEDTYPYKLKRAFPEHEIVTVGIGGATVVDISRQVDYYKEFMPDLTFIQVGVVDAAPRALSRLEINLLRKFRLLSLAMKFKDLLRNVRKVKYTSLQNFEAELLTIQKKLKHSNENGDVYLITIIPAHPEYEKILPSITDSIVKYNEVIKSNKHIDTEDIDLNQDILEDFHHLSKTGHMRIFEKISQVIRKHA